MEQQRSWLERHDRLQRRAQHWARQKRSKRLLGRAELAAAKHWLAEEPQDKHFQVSALQREYIAASAHRQRRRGQAIVVGLVLVGIAATTLLLAKTPEPPPPQKAAQADTKIAVPPKPPPPPPPRLKSSKPPATKKITHTVIPGETLESIATRYGASRRDICKYNRIPCDKPLLLGSELTLVAHRWPLPQQNFEYTTEMGEDSWEELASRFDTSVDRLRLYNPDIEKPVPGTKITIWADPQISRRENAANPPHINIPTGALSHGSPNDGWLENGIRLPESRDYQRRSTWLLFGSTHTLEVLVNAIARFRHEYHFDGMLVLSDISQKSGRLLRPHKSHQSGRDIDIWLPTIKGAYKDFYLRADRKPKPPEVHWLAAWALAKSLIDTGEVRYIFLNYGVQEKLFQAAQQLGATEQELDMIQWTPGVSEDNRRNPGIIRHAMGHTGHMHVRFKCSAEEKKGDCRSITLGADDDKGNG